MTDVETYSEEGFEVMLPSGSTTKVLSEGEVAWVIDKCDRYFADNHVTNISDIQDIDRLIRLELLCTRYSDFLNLNHDYFGQAIDADELRRGLTSMCVDSETEIFTWWGWRRYHDLVPGTQALTLNMDTGLAEWQPVKAIHIHEDGPYPVMELATRDHDSVTTLDHRWPIRGSEGGDRESAEVRFVQTWRLRANHSLVCWAPGAAATDPKYADAFVEIVSWFWTEGSAAHHKNGRFYNGTIHQSPSANLDHCLEIEASLRAHWGPPVGAHLPQNDRSIPLWRWEDQQDIGTGYVMRRFILSRSALAELQSVFEDFANKVLSTGFLVSLTQSQLSIFIAKSVNGDGWERRWETMSEARKSFSLRQSHEARAVQFATALVLAGYPVSINYEEGWGSVPLPGGGRRRLWRTGWRVSPREKLANCPIRALEASDRSPVFSVRDVVWCPETENGTWLAKRNGHIYYTGNSTEIRQLKAIIGITKKARDAERGEASVPGYLAKLGERAEEFGIHRDTQNAKIMELGMQLIALATLSQNCTEEERRELGITAQDFIDWVQGVFRPELFILDEHFRQNQKYWIQDL